MKEKKQSRSLSYFCFLIIRALVKLFYPKIGLEGTENLPKEPCLIVANHTQMNGPIIGELYIPGKRAIWCTKEMMHLKEVPAYAFGDFWSSKPGSVRWFYRILSYAIAPLSVIIFNNARTIPVYRDAHVISTFRDTVSALEDGARVVVFPECAEKHNNIINRFQEGFVDIARMYRQKTGKNLSFVPAYIAPKLKTVYFGKPVSYDPDAPRNDERTRVCAELSDRITAIAAGLPRHRVVPYNNIPKKDYPFNRQDGSGTDK